MASPFRTNFPELLRQTTWRPKLDVYRSPGGWIVKAELAGVEPEDISVAIDGNALELRGVRRDQRLNGEWRHYALEISYSRFERRIELPDEVCNAAVSWDFQHGMLLVRLATHCGD